MFKKIIVLVLVILVVFIGLEILVSAEVIKVRFGINQDITTPQYRSSMEFAEKVKELSNGQILVTVYPSMQLGDIREQAEMVQTGAIEMSKQPATVWSNFSKTFEAFDIPFLFKNSGALHDVVNGPIGAEIANTLKDEEIVPLGFSTGGLKQMTANKPIHNPDDLKGMKFRIMPAQILVKTYESFGANPTPIGFGEMYNALQQGVVDGQENPLQTVDMMKLWEVQKHLSLTNNGPMLYLVGANKKWFEALSKDLQQNIIDAFKYALEREWKDNDMAEAGWLENAKKNGMIVYTLTETDMQAFRDKSKDVVDFIKERVGATIVDKLLMAAEEANKNN